MKHDFVWTGKACSVNKWMDANICAKNGRKGAVNLRTPGPMTTLTLMTVKKYFMGFVYPSREYKAFKASIARKAKDLTPIAGYCDVTVRLFLQKGADTDGPIKGLFDALTDSKVIEDDKYIRNMAVLRHYHSNKRKNPVPDVIQVQLVPVTDLDNLHIQAEIKDDYGHI